MFGDVVRRMSAQQGSVVQGQKQFPAGGRQLTTFKTVWEGQVCTSGREKNSRCFDSAQGVANTPMDQLSQTRSHSLKHHARTESADGTYRRPILPKQVSTAARPMWAQYGEGGTISAMRADPALLETRTLAATVGAGTRSELLEARKAVAQTTLNSQFGGDMANPHSFGRTVDRLKAPRQSGLDTASLRLDTDKDPFVLRAEMFSGFGTRSSLFSSRQHEREQDAKRLLNMGNHTPADISTRAQWQSKSLTQRRRLMKNEQRAAAERMAPRESLGVHRKPLPKFAAESDTPWHAISDEAFRCSVQRPFAEENVHKLTADVTKKTISLASTRPQQVSTPISLKSTSLVQLKKSATKHKLPENPAKIDHFDMANAGSRTYKLEYTTKKRWTSAVIDHIKLTEEANSRSQTIQRPKGLINPREFEPLYSSFTEDNIFRERHQKGTNLRADAEIEETPVGESMRRERKAGQIYGEFVPLAQDEEKIGSLNAVKAARDRRLQESHAVQMPLTPATLRLANRQNSSDAFEDFASSSVFERKMPPTEVTHFDRFTRIRSAPQKSSRQPKPTAQHRFSASNRFHIRTSGLS